MKKRWDFSENCCIFFLKEDYGQYNAVGNSVDRSRFDAGAVPHAPEEAEAHEVASISSN
jgi:hypothetical protein